MVHDRGKIKWASLMLPEHVEMLREFFEEDPPMNQRPILSEDQRNEMEYIIQQAISMQAIVNISYVEHGYRYRIKGAVERLDPVRKKITIQEQHRSEKKHLSTAAILAIEISGSSEKP